MLTFWFLKAHHLVFNPQKVNEESLPLVPGQEGRERSILIVSEIKLALSLNRTCQLNDSQSSLKLLVMFVQMCVLLIITKNVNNN